MKLPAKDHPLWLIGMMLALGGIYAAQAKSPDWDEIRNWLEVTAVIGVREFLMRGRTTEGGG